MALKFGTSGLRGLVTEMTPEAVAAYARAFVAACDCGDVVCVGRDLRGSSPRIATDVITAVRATGLQVIDCGPVPTPALALAAQHHGGGAVMVTGSHIPADRNGLKFYTRDGEITKDDETAILAAFEAASGAVEAAPGTVQADDRAGARFAARYLDAFGAKALKGLRIGVFSHSAVGRDMLTGLLRDLGAQVIELGRSESFIPVDTEAVDAGIRQQISNWVKIHDLSALVSTDGDSDRPLLADETGQIVPGDIMGQITAETLGAKTVVTPISSNSGVAAKACFDQVIRTQIGSPFVIAAMQAAPGAVVGYEANGGFLLGFAAQGPTGPLAPLVTRDCVLPLLATLWAARDTILSARVAEEPPVVTLSDRLQEIPQDRSRTLIATLAQDATARAAFLAPLGQTAQDQDMTDGLRLTLQKDCVLHIRPSGNAPELRLYVEARTAPDATDLMQRGMDQLRAAINAIGT